MKVKVFHIRLTKEHSETDQNTINNFLDSVTVLKTETELISGQINFWSILTFYDNKEKDTRDKTSNDILYNAVTELTDTEKEYYESLRLWRQDKADHLGTPNFMICHNSELISIAKIKPSKIEDLNNIKGFGNRKIAKYGDDIIALFNSILNK
ncbi:MAG: HRDC domain-containing protein [Paludibacter sp.]